MMMMMMKLVVLLFVFATTTMMRVKGNNCGEVTFSGATYDLSSFNGDYRIVDSDPEVAYEYIFSVCRDVDSTYLSSQTSACVGDTAPGYQIDTDDTSKCYALGSTYTTGLNHNWKLHDPENPAGGVVLQYLNGDACYTTGTKRKLDIHFICRDASDKASEIPDGNEYVEEPSKCEYELKVFSGMACPQECLRTGGVNVCDNHGVCGYDNVLEKARCFCDEGYKGDDCSSKGSSSSSSSSSSSAAGTHAALVVVCLLLVGVLGIAAYMWTKLRKLQLDPDAYSQLGNRFNELGQVAESEE